MAAKEQHNERTANRLITERSPYLLQHAHNPVDWYPWGEEAFEAARASNKLLLISIGYSSCHWCHVMERECFEDGSIAAVMNANFICIKVDREERPDVDHVYMSAVQLMTGRGGWPLNCFALSDGRPMHGGTYFPRAQWEQVLLGLARTYEQDPDRVIQHAERLRLGLVASNVVEPVELDSPLDRKAVHNAVRSLVPNFDRRHGGMDRAPKFPLPVELHMLLEHGLLANDQELVEHVHLTLERMALGGIFDQLGGGFARYSTDVIWKVPHFEKMLYDNAQLVSVYAAAHQHRPNELYADTVRLTLSFIEDRLTAPDGLWYSALDADTDGVEGRFYVWQRGEMEDLLGSEFDLAAAYFQVNERGHWENGDHILLRASDDHTFALSFGIPKAELRERIAAIRAVLMKARDQRTPPGLDDKCLTSWNALMVKAYCDAHYAFGEEAWSQRAVRGMEQLLSCCKRADGGLWHSVKDGQAGINGYLEDHAFVIDALLALYQITFKESWIQQARALAEHAIRHYHDPVTGLFHFTSDLDPPLITRHREIADSVMPSSNSSFARSLFLLGRLCADDRYIASSARMEKAMRSQVLEHPAGHANWIRLMHQFAYPFREVVITGPDALRVRAGFHTRSVPNCLFAGATHASDLPLMHDRIGPDTRIFVCVDQTCQLPVTSTEEALRLLS